VHNREQYIMALLDIGSSGSAVRSLQQRLQRAGYSPGSADGQYGQRTANAVAQYQKSHGLQVDGRAGNQTFHSLQSQRNSDTFTPASTGPQRARTTTTRPGERPYQAIQRFGEQHGFRATSTTGGHHLGRGHREGRAVDFSVRGHSRAEQDQFIRDARAQGYWVNDERRGGNSAWTGPHIHVEQR
jgi:hypothetical protein